MAERFYRVVIGGRRADGDWAWIMDVARRLSQESRTKVRVKMAKKKKLPAWMLVSKNAEAIFGNTFQAPSDSGAL